LLGAVATWAACGALAFLAVSCTKTGGNAGEPVPAAAPPAEHAGDVTLSEDALAAADLHFATAQRMPRRTAISVVGTLAFPQSDLARVGPLGSGRVVAIPVTPGQKVARGDVLVSLDSAEAGTARADLAAADARLKIADAELARELALKVDGATTERAILAARGERDRALADVASAKSRALTYGGRGASSRVDLTSPMEGTVLEVKARIGQPVSGSDTLVIVGNSRRMWLEVDIYERDLSRVHIGDDVRVRTVAYPERLFLGHVETLALAVDPERRVVGARISLPNDDGLLRAGMSASGRILGVPTASENPGDGGTPEVVAVPKSAIQAIDGQPFVFVAAARREAAAKKAEKHQLFSLVAVERGAELDAANAADGAEPFIEIRRGLSGGETVVTDGSFVLKSEALKSQMGSND
jgi:cobalt-zinc-cadmium efflux system membrane fusion protein